MNRRSQILDELKPLLVSLTDGSLNSEQYERCIELLRSSEEARDVYFDFVIMQAEVEFEWSEPSAQTKGANQAKGPDDVIPNEHADGVADTDVNAAESPSATADQIASGVDPSHIAEMLDELSDFADEVADASKVAKDEPAEPPKVKHKKWDAVLPPDNTPLSMLGIPLPWAFGIAAMIAVVAAFFFLPTPEKLVVATLVRQSADVTWGSGTATIDGDQLRAGTMRLTRGRVWMTFFNGAQVGIEGPATFTLEEGHQMRLQQGELVGYCPIEARGFVVKTPGSTVVDLGTEFAVTVDKQGTTDVHVLEGSVELEMSAAGGDAPGHTLSAGNARQVDAAGTKTTEIDFEAAKFVNLRILLNRNLIVNGDFEADGPCKITVEGGSVTSFEDMAMTGWKDDTRATAAPYEMPGATESHKRRDEGTYPENRGKCYFLGVERGTTSQTIDVSALAQEIDAQRIQFRLSGWLGGQAGQDDALTVRAIALDERGKEFDSGPFGAGQIGPLTPADRNYQTGLWRRTNGGELPQGTRYVRIDLVSTSTGGGSVDAHGDNLSLTLSLRKPAAGKDGASP